GRARRHDLHAGRVQPLGQLLQPGLVVHADQRATHGLALLRTHGMVTFRPLMVQPSRTSRPTYSTSWRRSTCLIRSVRLSSLSSSRTGAVTWATIGPVSTPPSTKNRVAPVTLTPYASASRGPWMPGKLGSSALWVLRYRSPNAPRNASPTSLRKPAEITRSGWYAATDPVSAASHPARSGESFPRCTKVGTPRPAARSSPSIPSRSAPTATPRAPYAGSAQASSRAWRLEPDPDTSTPSFFGSGTYRTLPSGPERPGTAR